MRDALPPAFPPTRRALVIGVNGSAHEALIVALASAESDARAIAAALAAPACGFVAQSLTSEQATANGLRQAIADLLNEATPATELLVYFSGHAVQIPLRPLHNETFLVTSDFNAARAAKQPDLYLSLRWLYDHLYRDQTACSVLVFLDCCFAGDILGLGDAQLLLDLRAVLEQFRTGLDAQTVTRYTAKLRAIISAVGPGQKAREHDGMGLATRLLHELLTGAVPQAALGDGRVTVDLLIDHLRKSLPKLPPALLSVGQGLYVLADYRAEVAVARTDDAPPPPQPVQQAKGEAPPLPQPSPRPRLDNPFTPGTVAPSDRFFGREEVREAIISSVQSMQSLSLVGEARIGKSSLLRYLEAQIPEQLAPYGRYRPIYLSKNSVRNPGAFCDKLLTGLLPYLPAGAGEERAIRQLEASLARDELPSLKMTERVIAMAVAAGVNIVLLLDEFKDLLERREAFDALFCGWLRSLYTDRQLALVMATRQPLTAIPDLALYFLNGLSGTHTLGPLDPRAAEALLRQPHDRPFSAAELRLGLRVGETHPFRLQIVGDQLYRGKGLRFSQTHKLNGSLHKDAEQRLRDEVNKIFDQGQKLSGGGL